MPMALLGVWIGVALVVWGGSAAWLIQQEHDFPPLLAGLGGLIVGLAWPLVLPAFGVGLFAKKIVKVVG